MKLISILLILSGFLFASDNEIEINFKDLEINEFVKMVSKISDKNILLSSIIPGKVNFISVQPIDKKQVYDLLISVLKNKGYTLIDSKSGYLEIVRSSDAMKESPPFKGESELNQIQTDIIGIHNLSATEMLAQVNFLLGKYGKIAVSNEANSLVITDYPQNLASIRGLIKRLDSQKKMDIEFFTLQYSKVISILPKIISITESLYNQKISSQKVDIFADEGTNTLVMVSSRNIIDALLLHVKKLDKKDAVSERTLHIITLKNSEAKTLALTLEAIISNKPIASAVSTSSGSKLKKDSDKLTLSATSSAVSGTSSNKYLDRATFTADVETNTLIIYSSEEELKEINILISALDVPRQQVFVSAKIVEISDDKSRAVGVKYGVAGGVSNSSGLYTFSANLGGPAVAISDFSKLGLDIPVVTKGIALGAAISLLDQSGAANLLSEPSLLCVNNLESSIYVGRTESIISQGSVGSSTTDITKNTYTREDIGLTLKVKPRISSDNKVLLDVKVTLEDVVPGSTDGLPTTTKRDILTTAIVKNGESIIIGGLVRDKTDITVSKVPLLGDIPLLGYAFRHDVDEHDKINLVIVLTPYIVDDALGLSSLREELAKLNAIEKDFAKSISDKQNSKNNEN